MKMIGEEKSTSVLWTWWS